MTDSRQRRPEKAKSASPERKSGASRRPLSLGSKRAEPKSTKSVIISGVVHVVLAAVLLRLITFGHGLDGFFDFGDNDPVRERLTYVEPRDIELPKPKPAPPKPITPPVARPSTGPVVGTSGGSPIPVPPDPPARDTGGSGTAAAPPTVGAVSSELRGVQPGYSDPRIWGTARPGLRTERNGAEHLDSIISYAITTAADSVEAIARANGETGRRPGDWTRRDKNGDKWGWDEGGIRLGKITIPNALLMFLPLNAQQAMSGNPTAIDRERRLAAARRDIQNFSGRGIGEAEFKKLVKELRARKEREHQEKQKEKQKIISQKNNN